MTTETHDHQDGCLMCAVRALTEGEPRRWAPTMAGDMVSGAVLRQGVDTTNLGSIPFVDLWLGGHDRIRVMAYGMSLQNGIAALSPQIGDTMTVQFDGTQSIDRPGTRFHGREYRSFTVRVERGH